eukprot:maker-scaffold510_size151595-snap-gene-0.41 protein:Tk04764 transcript:maker-scaffold510_size151595-snap-gene-0.41-mRNA-1 annotation:"mite group 2 allergen pso o 2 precursor"
MVGGPTKAVGLASISFNVEDEAIGPAQKLELLGVTFDSNFSTSPHGKSLATAARQRAGLITRLAHHVPRGEYLRRLAGGLVVGKIGYAAVVVVPPRLTNNHPPTSTALKAVQVAINDVARTITGKTRQDRIRIPDLLHIAGLPSLNELSVGASVMETWKAFHSTDGEYGGRNPIGRIVFPPSPDPHEAKTMTTRSKAAGIILLQLLTSANTFANNASKIWNEYPELREGKSEIYQVELDGCSEAPCTVHRGDVVTGRVIFLATEATEALTCNILGNIGGAWLPFPGGCHSVDACLDLSSGDCPLEAGEEIVYEISDFKIENTYPVTDVIGQWNLKTPAGDKFVCFEGRAEMRESTRTEISGDRYSNNNKRSSVVAEGNRTAVCREVEGERRKKHEKHSTNLSPAISPPCSRARSAVSIPP